MAMGAEDGIARGLALKGAGRTREAESVYRGALSAARSVGDWSGGGRAAVELALVVETLGWVEEAAELLEEALEAYHAVGNAEGVAEATGYLGFMRQSAGRTEEAEELYEAALRMERGLGRRAKEAECLTNLGNLHLQAGRLLEAEALCEDALEICDDAGDGRGSPGLLLAQLRLAQDRPEEAEALCKAAMEGCGREDCRTMRALVWTGLAQIHSKRGAGEQEGLALDRAAELFHEAGHARNACGSYERLARWARDRGDLAGARSRYLQAAQVAEEMALPGMAARLWYHAAGIDLLGGDTGSAKRALGCALGLARAARDKLVSALVHRRLGACHMAQNRFPEGVAALAIAARLFEVAGDQERAAEARRAMTPQKRPRGERPVAPGVTAGSD